MPDDDRPARELARATYEVTVTIDPGRAERFERYMRAHHIPDVLATGCFLGAAFEREAPGRYRTRYMAATAADLERYLVEHTGALRADFVAHFPHAQATRANWDELERWGRV